MLPFLRLVLVAAALIGLGAAAQKVLPPAYAQGSQIDAAKASGVVGERIDGYLGIVDDGAADASLRRKVQEINARRRAAYDELARDTGTTVAQVARVTGERQIERASPGEFYMDENGRWVRK